MNFQGNAVLRKLLPGEILSRKPNLTSQKVSSTYSDFLLTKELSLKPRNIGYNNFNRVMGFVWLGTI